MDIIELVVILAVVVIPALAVTLRLSLGPLVDAMLRLRDGVARTPISGASTAEVEALRERIASLEARVDELAESESFYRELLETERARPQLPAERGGPGPGS